MVLTFAALVEPKSESPCESRAGPEKGPSLDVTSYIWGTPSWILEQSGDGAMM